MSDYYILDGHHVKPAGLLDWAKWYETADRQIANTELGDVRISTVFLGLDHSFGDGPPQIFETLVFEGPLDGEMDRYSTWDEAMNGHDAMCKRVKALFSKDK